MTQQGNLLSADGEVYYFPGFFAPKDADRYLAALAGQTPWKQEPIRLFGKLVMQPRLTALYGDADTGYGYSGIEMTALPWTPVMSELRAAVEAASAETFNVVLLNYYRSGQDSMGWHRDNEKELGPRPFIASISLGAPRRFLLRRYGTKSNQVEVLLEHGSLLVMKGNTQHYWEHSLPKTARDPGGRINLTFRRKL